MVEKFCSIIGANYGDEGKGLATDYFATKDLENGLATIVVCVNGGAQRGHTVVRPDGFRHVFHHLGSGALSGADTYLSQYFIVEPMSLQCELKELAGKRIGDIYVSANCRVTTPYEIILNQMLEQSRANAKHGSCGMGIWETVKGYIENSEYLRYGQIDDIRKELSVRREKFIRNLYTYKLHGEITQKVFDDWQDVINSEALLNSYADSFYEMKEICKTVNRYELLRKYNSVITENGQGLLLNESKNNVHTTPSNTGIRYIKEIEAELGMPTEPIYITRTYITRHGAGSFPTDEIEGFIDKTNKDNPFQGTMRFGRLDKSILQRIWLDAGKRKKSLFITHANEILPYEFLLNANGFEKIYISSSEITGERVDIIRR